MKYERLNSFVFLILCDGNLSLNVEYIQLVKRQIYKHEKNLNLIFGPLVHS